MSTQNFHWYSINEGSRYPVDDAATGVDDSGVVIDNSVIVDLNIRWPSYLGAYAYVSSIHVSAAITTVTLAVCDSLDDPASSVPLATISCTRPLVEGRQYALAPAADGVGGWIVFGAGAGERLDPYSARFTSGRQTLLTARAARPYDLPGVLSVRSSGGYDKLRGLVKLRGESPLEIFKGERVVSAAPGSPPVEVIVFRLADTVQNTTREESGGAAPASFYRQYAGPCGGRPESRTCVKPPIEFINNVGPDCSGKITLEFHGYITGAAMAGEPGVVLSSAVGTTNGCPKPLLADSQGFLPSDKLREEPMYAFVQPLPRPPQTSQSISDSYSPDGTLPLNLNLSSGIGSFAVKSGAWAHGAYYYSNSLVDLNVTAHPLGNVSTVFRKVTTQFRLNNQPGSQFRAGLTLNYRDSLVHAGLKEFLCVYLQQDTQSLSIAWFDGYSVSLLGTCYAPNVVLGDWYQLQVIVKQGDIKDTTWIHATLTGLTVGTISVTLDKQISGYRPSKGLFGLVADRTIADFGLFKVENNR